MKKQADLLTSGVTTELLKFVGSSGNDELLLISNQIISDCKVPQHWTGSLTVAIFKIEGDPLQCKKRRGLRLLEHSMKVFENILDRRLSSVTHILEGQCGFMRMPSSLSEECRRSTWRRGRNCTISL